MRNFHPTNERTIRFSLRVSASFDVFDAIWLFCDGASCNARIISNFIVRVYMMESVWTDRSKRINERYEKKFRKDGGRMLQKRLRRNEFRMETHLCPLHRRLEQEFDIVSNSVDY